MIHLLSHLLALLALGALCWLTGEPLGRFAGGSRLDRLLVSVTLGLGVWVALLFALASLQLLSPGPVLATLAVVAALGGWLQFARRSRAPARVTVEGSPPSSSTLPERLGSLLLLLPLSVVTGVLFLQAMRPNVSWDANVYHLTVPRLFLEQGGFVRIPFNVYSNWPLNVELLFAFAMLASGYLLAKLVHFGFALLACLATYRLSARVSGRFIGLMAVTLFLANPVVLYEARIAYVDLAYAFFFAVAFGLLACALDHPCRSAAARRLLLLAGVAAGLAAGVKLSGFFAPLCLTLLFVVERRRRLEEALLRELPLFLAPAVLLLLPWLTKSLVLTGNPVYPLFFSVFGGPEWSLELAREHREWQRAIGMGRGLIDYLLLPVRVLLFGDFGYARFDGRINPAWIVLLPLSATGLAGRTTRRPVGRALLVAFVYFVLWAATSQQMRFLIPILPLLAMAAASSLGLWIDRVRSLPVRSFARAVLSLLAGASLLVTSSIYLRQTGRLASDLVRYGAALSERVVHPVYGAVDALLPEEARLLLVNTNHGFFLERPFVADSFFEASQIADALRGAESIDEVEARLRGLGTSHVLFEHRERSIRFPPALYKLLADPERAPLLYRSPEGRFTLHELRRAVPAAAEPPAR